MFLVITLNKYVIQFKIMLFTLQRIEILNENLEIYFLDNEKYESLISSDYQC